MKTCLVVLLTMCAVFAGAAPATAQVRITGGIAGTVVDAADAVVPGAHVQLKDEGTGVTKETATNGKGFFAFPDLNHGTFAVTVSLQGFQTAAYNKVVVEAGRTTDLRIKLAVGALEQVVTVEGASPVLETSSNLISGTINRRSLETLPLAGRNVFGLAALVPGAATAVNAPPHFNGMPGGVINPTIDGVNNSSNGWKSGGTSFFGTVPARLGAIEEVTVESSGQGAESGAMGGVNLKFVTRRGTNQYRGSAFWQHRNESLNANSFANNARELPKNRFRRHDFGGNVGGPLLPGTPLREKMFVFVNYEHEYIPQTATRTRTVLKPETELGIYTYQTASGELRTASVLDIARSAGFPATVDPLIANMLAQHRQSRQFASVNSTNSLLTEQLAWREPQKEIQFYPTVRLDYQITPNLAWMGSGNLRRIDAQGRRGWPLPDLPKQLDRFDAWWWITSTGLNWTINSTTHNELRYGVQHSGDTIPERVRRHYEQYNGVANGLPVRFPNNLPLGLAPIANDAAPITGRHYITTMTDTLTMARGNHSFRFGGTFRLTDWRDTSLDAPGSFGFLGLPQYQLGLATGDPAQGIFNSSTMPGIQNADLGDARALYALLTGRVSQVATGRILDPATGQYSDQVENENWTASKMGGIFAQDQWRVNPNLTLNYGLRYEITGAQFAKLSNANFPDVANLYGPSSALFQPGVLNGVQNPTLTRGRTPARTDYNNVAPNFGFSWTPAANGGWLGKIVGAGHDTVIRGGYSMTYYDEGTNMFAWNAGSNPGRGQALRLQPGIGFEPGTLTLQTPLPPFVAFPVEFKEQFPQSDFTFANSVRTMKDDLQTPYVHSWNIGVQRQIMKHTVLEARYLGTRGENVWRTYNLNEVNIFENQFLDEFRQAQGNLAINLANGRSGFANNGLPGQAPLPIFETAFGARGSQQPLSPAAGFTSGGFITSLQNGEAGRLAQSLAGNANYVCRMFGSTFAPCGRLGYDAPGPYPINFFYLNPYAGGQGAWLVDDSAMTRYHSLQLQLRRRYAQGLQLTVNYTLGKATNDLWAESPIQDVNYRTLRDRSLDVGPAHYDVRHVVQAFGTYDLPIGEDRRFRIGNPLLNAVVGGWTLGSTLRAQSGSPFTLGSGRWTVNQYDAGVVLVNGTTVEDIQNAIRWSDAPGLARYWIDPKFIGPDGRANPDFIRPPTEPGELGQRIILRGKNTWVLDASLNKHFELPGRAGLRVHLTMTNVLNHPVFSTPAWNQTPSILSPTFGQVSFPLGGIYGAREMYLRTEFIF